MADPIVEGIKKLSTPVLADIFRYVEYPQQVMEPTILPFKEGWKVCGRAFTHANLPMRKYEKNAFRGAESKWAPGDVIVEGYWGAWGLNFAIGAQLKGCAGGVVDGSYRDIPEHKKILPDFPVFCRRGLPERSSNPGGSHRGFPTRWMCAYNVPVNCGGVLVNPGDIILGDEDGVVVIPKEIEEAVLKFAISYDAADAAVAQAKREGKGLEEAYGYVARWPKESGLLEWLAKSRPGSGVD